VESARVGRYTYVVQALLYMMIGPADQVPVIDNFSFRRLGFERRGLRERRKDGGTISEMSCI
jgi:hypothetical protein